MKKRYIVLIALVITLGLCGILGLNYLFPKAKPIETGNFQAVTVSHNNEKQAFPLPEGFYTELKQYLSKAKPTREMSLDDNPSSGDWYRLEFLNESIIEYRTLYIYERNGTTYLEMPYDGIYISEKDFLEAIKGFYENQNP